MNLGAALHDFEDMLNGTCTIRTATEGTLDTWGSPVKTWANKATGVKCCVQPRESKGQMFAGSQEVLYDYVIFLQYTAAWTPNAKDRITTFTLDGVVDTKVYELVAVQHDAGGNADGFHHWKCGANTVSDT